MPGPNASPRLIVSGSVTVPTGGYRVALRMGQVAESYPVQVTVYLDATPPTGMASQALVTHDVRGSWASEERVGSVTVRCGSRTLARMTMLPPRISRSEFPPNGAACHLIRLSSLSRVGLRGRALCHCRLGPLADHYAGGNRRSIGAMSGAMPDAPQIFVILPVCRLSIGGGIICRRPRTML